MQWNSLPFLLVGIVLAYDGFLRKKLDQVYRRGAIATEHPKCSQIGAEIMEKGGSAVDSAIAALLCVGVINNFAAGIGGGGIMLVRRPDGEAEVIDFREVAPSSAHRDMFNHNHTLATDSTLGAGVPGEIKGFEMAHQKYGRLPWADLFEPSIKVALEGFPVTPKMADMISKFAEKMKKSEGMWETYLHKDGSPKKEGEWITRPNLAQTLQTIAQEGADAFYHGSIATSLADFVASKEGGFTLHDLASYKAISRSALIDEALGHKIITAGLPSCGPMVIQLMKVMEKLEIREGNQKDPMTMQQLIEAFKFAYVDRMKLGDPAFIDNASEIVAQLTSDERATHIASLIDPLHTHPPEYYMEESDELSDPEAKGTAHVSVMDNQGYAVSVTSTINLEWGCRYMDPLTGIILNNELDDFSIPHVKNSFGLAPSEANFIAAGKRPLSSASLVILEREGSVWLTIGAAGGSRIITAVAETIFKLLVLGMNPDDAMDTCRLHHQLLPNAILAEHRCDAQLIDGLQTMGHNIVVMPTGLYASCVNLVMRSSDGALVPVADKRKGGMAAGI